MHILVCVCNIHTFPSIYHVNMELVVNTLCNVHTCWLGTRRTKMAHAKTSNKLTASAPFHRKFAPIPNFCAWLTKKARCLTEQNQKERIGEAMRMPPQPGPKMMVQLGSPDDGTILAVEQWREEPPGRRSSSPWAHPTW